MIFSISEHCVLILSFWIKSFSCLYKMIPYRPRKWFEKRGILFQGPKRFAFRFKIISKELKWFYCKWNDFRQTKWFDSEKKCRTNSSKTIRKTFIFDEKSFCICIKSFCRLPPIGKSLKPFFYESNKMIWWKKIILNISSKVSRIDCPRSAIWRNDLLVEMI
jgi:hypothetical protein